MTLIAVKTPYEEVMAYFNNDVPDAMHYQEGLLNEYVKGGMAKLVISGLNNHEDCQYLVEGNKLAFRFEDKDYDLSIVTVFKNERNFEITAISNSFELLFETYGEYSGKSMSFEQYFNVFKAESAVTIGINEVSEKRISNEWTGKQTLYARLFSLAEVFGAEIEFVTKLNDDYSLQSITANVYKEYADGVQGIGQNRTDLTFKYGKDVTTIGKTSDINDLYTAIKAYGKDGLSINDIEREWLDADGKVEYFTRKGQPRIYAPQARDRFPSTTFGSQSERYIGFDAESTEYSTAEALCGYMLSELKKNCVPKVTYDIEGDFDVNVGDTVIMEDDGYKPTLYLEVRAGETEKSLVNKRHRKMVVSNVKELASEIDASLLDRVQALIDANKTYQYSISTDNGIVFKNNTGTTTLTANVKNGVSDLTSDFSIAWYKDGVAVGTGVSITVQATEIVEKAVYRFEASRDGNVVGGYEVTVSDVTDGEEGFSPIVTPNDNGTITIVDKEGEKTTPDLTGPPGPAGEVDQELIDEITNAAEDAKKAGEAAQEAAEQAEADSALAVENANNAVNKANEASAKADQSQQTADQAKSDATNAAGKAQSALDSAGQAVSSATDALNQANIAKSQAEEAIEKYLGMGMVPAWSWSPDGTDRFTTVEPGENLLLVSKLEAGSYDYKTGVPTSGQDLKRNTVPIEVDKTASYVVSNAKPAKSMRFFFYDANGGFISVTESINANTYKLVVPSNATTINYIFWAGASTNESYKFWKLEKGINPTIYTPAPSDDYTDAVPSYIGFAIESSDNPADYTWIRNPEKVEGEVKVELTEINGELSRKVSQETFDQLNGTVINHSSLISQNQNEIKQKASQESVNTLTGRVTSAEGSISTIAGQVALKANQTDVDTIAGRVTSAESQLTVQTGKITALNTLTDGHTSQIGSLQSSYSGLSSTVSKVQNDLDGLEIGGRNLIVNYDGSEQFVLNNTTGEKYIYPSNAQWITLLPNTKYTMSALVKVDKTTARTVDLFMVHMSGTQHRSRTGIVPTTNYQLVYFTFTTSDVAEQRYYPRIDINQLSTPDSVTLFVKQVKLEKGTKPTDWTPAPEDMATVSQMSSLTQTVDSINTTVINNNTNTQSQINQMSNQITSVVGSVTNPNLIANSGHPKNLDFWRVNEAGALSIYSGHQFYENGTTPLFLIKNPYTDKELTASTNRFPVIPGKKYTLSGIFFADTKVISADIWFLGRPIGSQSDFTKSVLIVDKAKYSSSRAEYKQYTFEMPSDISEGYIRIDNNGSSSSTAYLFFADLKLEIGGLATPWVLDGSHSQITQLSDAINFRITNSDGSITQIDLANKVITLSGEQVNITGNTYIANGVIKTAHIADLAVTNAKIGSLSADKVTVGTLNGANVNIINLNANNIVSGEISGINIRAATFYGTSENGTMQLNGTDLRFDTTTNSFRLNYGGISNVNTTYGTRNITFFSEGIEVASGASNTGNYKNSGVRVNGTVAYLDLFSAKSTTNTDYAGRVVAEAAGNLGIVNPKGSVYINSAAAINLQPLTNVSLNKPLQMNGNNVIGAGNLVGTTGTGGWAVSMINIMGITSKPYLNVTSGSSSWGVDMWTSDMRLKTNIQKTPDNGLELVDQLMVRAFDWRDSERHTDYGLIAQNVERVLPQAVFEVSQPQSGSIKQISVEGLMPIVVKAIQELKQDINTLKETI